MKLIFKHKILIIFFLFFFLFPAFANADTLGQRSNFFIDSSFSTLKESQVAATLQKSFIKLNFYFDNNWWNQKTEKEKENIILILENINNEFENNIYPVLTNTFGSEGYSNQKTNILFYPMRADVRGYVRNIDSYEKIIAPESNERKMIYLNADNISKTLLRDDIAHEFMHLITINQKEKRIGQSEDLWLNEARSEYVPTLLGYNESSKEDNYLKRRARSFIEKPTTSFVEWEESSYSYSSVNVFIHYLVDHYGLGVLVDSLKSSQKGIESIDYALRINGSHKTFSDIFSDWVIASYINDCSVGEYYCYKNKNLINLSIIPFNNFIPFSGNISLSIGQTISSWSAQWQRFTGTRENLNFQFDGRGQEGLRAIYIIKYFSGRYEIKELSLDENKNGEIVVNNLGTDKYFITIIPFSQVKNDKNTKYFYYINVSSSQNIGNNTNNNNENIKLPFAIDKPLNQMNREELLMVVIRTIIYLLVQGKLVI